jgi:hypothetical protein
MTIVISHGIRRKEFKRGIISAEELQIIRDAYAEGIMTPIKGEALPKASRLVKIYVTTVAGARRIVFLVDVATGTGFFLMYRGKNDPAGENISIKNPAFRMCLLRYLALLDGDIEAGRFDAYP